MELLHPSYFSEREPIQAGGRTGRESRDGDGKTDHGVIEYLDETAPLDLSYASCGNDVSPCCFFFLGTQGKYTSQPPLAGKLVY